MSGKILKQKSKGRADVPKRLRAIDRRQRHAVLATVSDAKPYTSLIAFALTPDNRHILFVTPKGTHKYKNITKNKNVSLLIHTARNISKDYADAEAVTVQGKAHTVRSGRKRKELAEIILKKHPRLKAFVNASSSALVMVRAELCVHVSRFQEVTEWRFE